MTRSPSDLRRAADQAGGVELVSTRPVTLANGAVVLSGTFRFSDPWAAARLLVVLSEEDAADPVVDRWGRSILDETERTLPRGATEDDRKDAFAQAVHGNVQGQIDFAEEEGERFQSAEATMVNGVGDCDCHARLVHALGRSQGLQSDLGFFSNGTEPVHVAAMLETSHGLAWAETTIDAEFGEHPYTAYRRLGLGRSARRELSLQGLIFPTIVLPSTVDSKKAQLDAVVSSLNLDVLACPSLDAQTRAAWESFVARWSVFAKESTGWFDTAAEMDQAEEYETQITGWQQKLAGLCKTSAPGLPVPAGSQLSTLLVVGGLTAAVIATAAAVKAWAPPARRK